MSHRPEASSLQSPPFPTRESSTATRCRPRLTLICGEAALREERERVLLRAASRHVGAPSAAHRAIAVPYMDGATVPYMDFLAPLSSEMPPGPCSARSMRPPMTESVCERNMGSVMPNSKWERRTGSPQGSAPNGGRGDGGRGRRLGLPGRSSTCRNRRDARGPTRKGTSRRC